MMLKSLLKETKRIDLFFILLISFIRVCVTHQPPYQVSLFMKLPVKGQRPIYICNGAIIQSRLILTTASCVHYPQSTLTIQPFMISVVAGSSNEYHVSQSYDVSEVIVSNFFNATTLQNDVAILRLDKTLPLHKRRDMKWIVLDDRGDINNQPCTVNFQLSSSSYMQTEKFMILPVESCYNNNPLTRFRSNDICSNYTLPYDFDCLSPEDSTTERDRGVGFICKGHLSGLLSQIILPNITIGKQNECIIQGSPKAFYIDVSSHLSWIYNIVAMEEFKDIARGTHMSSQPYQPVMDELRVSDKLEHRETEFAYRRISFQCSCVSYKSNIEEGSGHESERKPQSRSEHNTNPASFQQQRNSNAPINTNYTNRERVAPEESRRHGLSTAATYMPTSRAQLYFHNAGNINNTLTMSLNGDMYVMRNGRSTSEVSVYNYPEHLNPFYEDDQHKRLRFWHIDKNNINEGRRKSFSNTLRDMWSFKTFRLKKKSSTLGINKTSESPPPLRRDFQYSSVGLHTYDPRQRYTANGTSTSLGSNFDRNVPYRSSLQNMYSRENFNRNDQYRSTIQAAGYGRSPKPNTSLTPQLLRNSRFHRGGSSETIASGISQSSYNSTNPFETEEDEVNEPFALKDRNAPLSNSTPKKHQKDRKKRRAPAPPVPIHGDSKDAKSADSSPTTIATTGTSGTIEQIDLHITESNSQDQSNLDISNLTAEIEDFVKNASNVPEKIEAQGKLISNNDQIQLDEAKFVQLEKSSESIENSMSASGTNINERTATTKHTNTINVESNLDKTKNQVADSTEIGHVECIHVHVDQAEVIHDDGAKRTTSFKTPPKVNIKPIIKPKPSLEGQRRQEPLRILETAHRVPNPIPAERKVSANCSSSIPITKAVTNLEPPSPSTTTITTSSKVYNRVNAGPELPQTLQSTQGKASIESHATSHVKTTSRTVLRQGNGNISEDSSLSILQDSHVVPVTTTFRSIEDNKNLDEQIERVDKPSTSTATPIATVTSTTTPTAKLAANTIQAIGATPADTSKYHVEKSVSTETQEWHRVPKSSPLKITESEENIIEPTGNCIADSNTLLRTQPELRPRLEWKQSTLAPLDPHIPPEKRKSVKDIIESINRSQRLLNAAAHRELQSNALTILSNDLTRRDSNTDIVNDWNATCDTGTFGTPLPIRRNLQQHHNGNNGISDEACGAPPSYEESQKLDNSEIIRKCELKKQSYDYRESSPTASNLDWNPLPKPKRTKNLQDP